MKIKTKLLRLTAFIASFVSLTCLSAPCENAPVATTVASKDNPSQYIEFISQLDGRCQNLSSGGKLRVVKNNHADKHIKYRFHRMFAGKRQAGITVGVLEPGKIPVKLGCTKVDGREQTWEIKIVNFVE